MITEAEWLWAAEDKKVSQFAEAQIRNSAAQREVSSWFGCVALMINPGKKLPQDVSDGWAEHICHRYNQNEGRLVNERGLLEIAWPTLIENGDPVPLDLLFATSNDPAPELPAPDMIATAWNAHPRERVYFDRNRENGITTFQDDAIAQRLR